MVQIPGLTYMALVRTKKTGVRFACWFFLAKSG